jgi:outer membrane biosynthesis protein TonB
VLGSILTRQYRFATRGIQFTLQTARQAIDVAEDVAGRLGLHNGHTDDDVVTGAVVPDPEPVASPPPPPPAPPPPPEPQAEPPRKPELPPEPPAEPPREPEPPHISTEPELVEEFSEPGAEDGAGAQVRVGEPWPGYRSLKARDVIARLPTATREELAAVELFEFAGANRKSVVVAAQRALKKASPPRGTTDQ